MCVCVYICECMCSYESMCVHICASVCVCVCFCAVSCLISIQYIARYFFTLVTSMRVMQYETIALVYYMHLTFRRKDHCAIVIVALNNHPSLIYTSTHISKLILSHKQKCLDLYTCILDNSR